MKILVSHVYSNSFEPTGSSEDRLVLELTKELTGRNKFVRVVYQVKWGAGMQDNKGEGAIKETTLTQFEKFAKADVTGSYA